MLERLCPDEIVPRLEHIDQQVLLERGIRGLLIDVDNTLVNWRGHRIPKQRVAWLNAAKDHFAICLLSNSITARRLRHLGKVLALPYVARWGWGRKPFSGGYREAFKLIGVPPSQTAMIGDQLLTDVFGGNRLGMHTILVHTVSDSEFFITRINRWIEAIIRARLIRRGLWPPVTYHEPNPVLEPDNEPG